MNIGPQEKSASELDEPLPSGPDRHLIERIVEAAREHLKMDVSFLAEFGDTNKTLVEVSGRPGPLGFEKGSVIPLEDTYCLRVVRGESRGVIPDSSTDPMASSLPITRQRQIGSYIGVPVTLPSGRLYGTLCCVSRESTDALGERDRNFLRALADLVAVELDRDRQLAETRAARASRIQSIIDAGGPRIAYQPIVNLETGAVVGVEALSRFEQEPHRSPDVWFAEAWEVDLGPALELVAARKSLKALASLPEHAYVSINLSPMILQTRDFLSALEDVPATRVVVEVTEHAAIDEFDVILESIEDLRDRGVRLAVDDLGAGYAGLSHALRLAPEILKLDNFLVAGIEKDRPRQALAFAASSFVTMTKGSIVAEGIETAEALETLRVLGVGLGQGFFLGRPEVDPDWETLLALPMKRMRPEG